MKEEKVCFVISPIGEPESDIRRRSDQVFKHIISPAIAPLGYKPIRADHISEPGIITNQVIQYVVESPLVIADLTGHNPNVFYELAIRHAIKKPLVQMMKNDEQIPFDVASTRTIPIDIQDLDSVENAKQELGNQIKSIDAGKTEIDSPISVALDLKILKESENPVQRSLADVVGAISGLRLGILSLENRISSPESIIPPEYLESIFRKMSHRYPLRPEFFFELRGMSECLVSMSQSKKLDLDEIKIISEKLRMLLNHMNKYGHEF